MEKSKNNLNKKLEKIYYDIKNPSSYGSVLKLAKAASTTPKKAKEWLMTQDTYTLHKPVNYKFPRRKVISYGIGDLIQCDLMDMSKFAKANKGYKYILVCIDVFSKFVHAFPLKNKRAKTLCEAFKKLLETVKPIVHIQTDRGTEFYNKDLESIFKKHKIRHYSTFSEHKACVAERVIRTIKNKLYKIFTFRNSYKYIDILQDVIKSYNSSVHKTHGYAPIKVTRELEPIIFEKMYGYKTNVKYKFNINDQVRISKNKTVFRRGYLPNWSEEVFTVYKRFPTTPPSFLLRDMKGTVLQGRFYSEEIQPVKKSLSDFWRVEKILKTRGENSQKEYLVKWLGFGPEHNSWVKKEWIKK